VFDDTLGGCLECLLIRMKTFLLATKEGTML